MMSQPTLLKSMKSLKYSTMNAMLTYLDKCFNMDVKMKTFQDQAAINTLINKYYYPNYKNSINNTINNQEYIETYIAHKDIFLLPDKKHLRLFILKDHILFTKQFKMDDTLTQNPIDTILQYKQIHSLSSDLTDKEAQLILYQIQGESFDSLHTYSICFTIQRDMIIFKHLIQRQLDLTWQCFFEKALPIPEPFYYQKHFFIEKQNRRRKRQQRTIVLCNKVKYIYL